MTTQPACDRATDAVLFFFDVAVYQSLRLGSRPGEVGILDNWLVVAPQSLPNVTVQGHVDPVVSAGERLEWGSGGGNEGSGHVAAGAAVVVVVIVVVDWWCGGGGGVVAIVVVVVTCGNLTLQSTKFENLR